MTLTEIYEKALVPAISYALLKVDEYKSHSRHGTVSPSLSHRSNPESSGTKRLLAILTISAVVALRGYASVSEALALGCCAALLIALSLNGIHDAGKEATGGRDIGASAIAANGFLSQHATTPPAESLLSALLIRDVAAAAATMLWFAAFALEDMTSQFKYAATLGHMATERSILLQQILLVAYGLIMVFVHVVSNASLITAVSLNAHSIFLSLIFLDA